MEQNRSVLGVLHDEGDRRRYWERSANHYGGYVLELLEHAGLAFERLSRRELTEATGCAASQGAYGTPPPEAIASNRAAAGDLPAIVLLPYPLRLSKREAVRLGRHLQAGGAVIACGGVEGGDELFGVKTTRSYLDEALLEWPEGALGLAGGRVPVWGVQLAQCREGTTAIGEVAGFTAASMREVGQGIACFLSVDIARSVVTMQQGRPVLGDALNAPDGSAAVQDGILKADDGAVIDWSLRQEGPEGPLFAVPFADRLRELLMALIIECAERVGVPLPLAWYWPDALPAVATLSFDTDSNEGPDGWAFLETLERLDVNGSWCVMYPGGYPRELYRAIASRGDELALHFDGLTSDLREALHCGWSLEDFEHQLEWLRQETGTDVISSQKNHVTRWEGWVELFRWLERCGIHVDQTKGPSKIGNLGFTFGTCHPWRPMEDQRHDNRRMKVLELPFLAHDMQTSGRRVALRRLLVDAVARHAGAAHFIFHPQRIDEEGMREAIADLVQYARALGLQWWTSRQIAEWEWARRRCRVSARSLDDGRIELEASDVPPGLSVLLFGLPGRHYLLEDGSEAEESRAFGRTAVSLALPQNAPRLVLTPL